MNFRLIIINLSDKKNKHNRNLLKLKIDSKGAIYDTSVKEIHFYNYKILTPDISLENRKIILTVCTSTAYVAL